MPVMIAVTVLLYRWWTAPYVSSPDELTSQSAAESVSEASASAMYVGIEMLTADYQRGWIDGCHRAKTYDRQRFTSRLRGVQDGKDFGSSPGGNLAVLAAVRR